LRNNDYEPLQRLSERLMECDWNLANSLLHPDKTNYYRNFLTTFAPVRLITFNYDSRPEMLLFHQGRWFPHDGYGIAVNAELSALAQGFQVRPSTDFVLHLHGSFCIYTVEFEIQAASGR